MENIRTYATRDEAIQAEVVAPIEASGDSAQDYDVEAIAAEVLYTVGSGTDYRWAADEDADAFWAAVVNAAK